MASNSRRSFSPQFKAEAVQMVVQNNRPITDVAQELAMNPGTLGNWVNKYRQDNVGQEEPLPVSERIRLSELESEVRRLRMENEFLNYAEVRVMPMFL